MTIILTRYSGLLSTKAWREKSNTKYRGLISLGLCMIAVVLAGCSDDQGAFVSARADSLLEQQNNPNTPVVVSTNTPVEPSPTVTPPSGPVETPVEPVSDPSVNPETPTDNPLPPPVTNNPSSPEPVVTNEPSTPSGTYDLWLAQGSNQITEGDNNGVIVSVNLNRRNGHNSPVTLSISEQRGDQLQSLAAGFDTQTIVGNQSATNVRFTLPIAAGPILNHSRTVTIQASDGSNSANASFELNVNPVPAPDVYLLIGQSNMTGGSGYETREGEPGQPDEVHPRIEQLNVERNSGDIFNTAAAFTDESINYTSPTFTLAEDPLHHPLLPRADQKYGSQIGPGLSFAKAMLPYTNQKIILVPAGWSATGFCRGENPLLGWNSEPQDNPRFGNTLLVDRAVLRTNVALRESGGILRGILWQQGEADANNSTCAGQYESNLVALVNALRSRINPDRRGAQARGTSAPIPFIAGTMSRGDDSRGEFSVFGTDKDMIDAAHKNIGNLVPFAATASAEDLVPPAYPCGSSSCVHFGATALREIGYRYHTKIQELLRANRR